ncbi:sce7725 family protein, partial [Yersinia intermedia]|uniref:sce7725 family protein n=1 Tax=Yersinia intermedia TaxID=631 RepID=UPI0011A1A3B1
VMYGKRTYLVRGFSTNSRIALLYDNPALTDAEVQLLASNPAVSYHVVLNGRMLPNQSAFLPMSKVIIVNDNFRKLARNADYQGVEYFTNNHQFVNVNYLGFGDYTITGRVLDLSGGPASAVAAHLIFKNLQDNTVWMQHFVSSNTQRNSSNIANKFLDVSDKITNFVPSHLNQYGNNIGLDYYYTASSTRHFPGLAKNKQYQITHHISFMLDLINGRI